ncbi:MAG: pimeloyl-CoA dehydrogenase large subunit [Rhodospirillaceae bacterium]|nr:pimeloyl-CoA dehydrogenase large subunit [Rhodospirillaceae bacterium]
MNIDLDDDLEAFRVDVRAFVRANLPDDIRRKVRREHAGLTPTDVSRWMRILYDHGGWSVPSWPVEHGGPGWSYEQQYTFERECALNDAPPLNVFSSGMVGPALIEFGNDDHKQRFLPGLANGDIILCQGYSEPNAGSDLASLQCKAERDGDEYVINGTKIWTSDATHANWMFGLFRTDSSGKKQHGISLLLIDMASPGLTISPIESFEGGDELNQTYFDNVHVPVGNRVGEENKGWGIGKYILGMERFGSAEVSRTMAMMARLKDVASREPAHGGRLIDDPHFAAALARAEISLRQVELTEQRMLFGPGGPDAMGFEASLLKVRGTEVQQQVMGLMVEALGAYGPMAIEDVAADGDNTEPLGPDAAVHASRIFYNLRKSTIWGGSTEVQKNIIAKAVLGL